MAPVIRPRQKIDLLSTPANRKVGGLVPFEPDRRRNEVTGDGHIQRFWF